MIKPKLHPFPRRLPASRLMTLISAFRCHHGIVLSADSQETIRDDFGEEYRRTVNKIAPLTLGNYQIVVAGSGHAELIEAFIIQITRALQGQSELSGIESLRTFAEDRLREFYENDVTLCPDEGKEVKLFIAAVCPSTHEFEVWVSENIRLRPIATDEPELIGVEYGLYSQTAKHLYRESMSIPQATLASIYLLKLAEQTSNWVRGPMKVVKINEYGIYVESEAHVQEIGDQLNKYDKAVTALFLDCADTSISNPDLAKSLEDFSLVALNLHLHHQGIRVSQIGIEVIVSNAPQVKPSTSETSEPEP